MKLRKIDYILFYLITSVILFMNLMSPIKKVTAFLYILLLSIVPALMLGTLTSLFLANRRRVLAFCGVLIVFSFVSYGIDSRLVTKDNRPIFVVPIGVEKDGGTTIYSGLGYKVIGWKVMRIKNIEGNRVPGKMTGYEISTWFHPQSINDRPKKELKFIPLE